MVQGRGAWLVLQPNSHTTHAHHGFGPPHPTAVADAGAGGQTLMDDATFEVIKERLHELGARGVTRRAPLLCGLGAIGVPLR